MKILITAGPTREPIDPIRYISNRSSGKMGYAIAQAAIAANHEVTLISGPVCIAPPANVHLIKVTTSDEMFDAVHAYIANHNLAVLSAAVADFKPISAASQKIKKQRGVPQITLVPTRDILASLGKISDREKKFRLVGFAAETESLAENAQKKLREKNCDLIVGNDVSRIDTGLESDDNALTLFFRNGKIESLARENKNALAKKLVKIFENLAKEIDESPFVL